MIFLKLCLLSAFGTYLTLIKYFPSLYNFQRTLLYDNGGDERIRTADPLLARQVLSRLSYTPVISGGPGWTRTIDLTLIRRAL